MDINELFAVYYALYRGDDEVPDTTDAEWTVFLRYVINAVMRWAEVDGMLWKELWTDLASAATGTKTVTAGTTTYAAPDDFDTAGGFVDLINGTDIHTVKVVQLEEEQVLGDYANVAWFTGNPSSGYFINFQAQLLADKDTWTINYPYYKTPIKPIADSEDGTTKLEMSDPMFAVHHALAQRFRASRNTTGYRTSLRDAETALGGMQHRNSMGTNYNLSKVTSGNTSAFGR